MASPISSLIDAKIALPTKMDSEEIARLVPPEIRRQAVYSAQMASKSYLSMLQRVLSAYADGKINASDARLRLVKSLGELGFDTQVYGLSDHASTRRLDLILKTNKEMAASQARLDAQTPDVEKLWPAWRLERYGTRSAPRLDWKARWTSAGDSVGWLGASKRDFVALKSSPIWAALGAGAGGYTDTLGNPYPPFAYASGLDWTDVGSDEARALGLIQVSNSICRKHKQGLSCRLHNKKEEKIIENNDPEEYQIEKIYNGEDYFCSVKVAKKVLLKGFVANKCLFNKFALEHYNDGKRRKDNTPAINRLQLLPVAVLVTKRDEYPKIKKNSNGEAGISAGGVQYVYRSKVAQGTMRVYVYANSGLVSGWYIETKKRHS